MAGVSATVGTEAPRVIYDREADVLYVSLGKPEPSYVQEDPDMEGLHYRYSLEENRLTGLTIVWYSIQDKEKLRCKIPFPVDLP